MEQLLFITKTQKNEIAKKNWRFTFRVLFISCFRDENWYCLNYFCWFTAIRWVASILESMGRSPGRRRINQPFLFTSRILAASVPLALPVQLDVSIPSWRDHIVKFWLFSTEPLGINLNTALAKPVAHNNSLLLVSAARPIKSQTEILFPVLCPPFPGPWSLFPVP